MECGLCCVYFLKLIHKKKLASSLHGFVHERVNCQLFIGLYDDGATG